MKEDQNKEQNNIVDMCLAVEQAAISMLKEYEDTDIWEQTELVEYVLDKAEEFGLIVQVEPAMGNSKPEYQGRSRQVNRNLII